MLKVPVITTLGFDPRREHRINANSFQQDALVTSRGWQYAAFYTEKPETDKASSILPLYINLARRRVPSTHAKVQTTERQWEIITFEDYEQTVDDGHNTISIGVCGGDGTIHMAFDHHCDPLKFRISFADALHRSVGAKLNASIFHEISNSLPGLDAKYEHLLQEVTYPRFVSVGDDLLFTHRIGKAGLGSDLLYHYSSITHSYTYLGQPLTGIANSPYINGISYSHIHNHLHLSWCYRAFIAPPPNSDPSTAHKVQAGYNGPENNSGLHYMYSSDLGRSWHAGDGQHLVTLDPDEERKTVLPSARGIMAYDIPRDSGVLNQEAQAVDGRGGFHVLNRERVEGRMLWMHYYRAGETGTWNRHPIPFPTPTATGSRGSLVADNVDNLYMILPGNADKSLTILRSIAQDEYSTFETIWSGDGYDGEPLVNIATREEKGDGLSILSVFTRTHKGEKGRSKIVVLDFDV